MDGRPVPAASRAPPSVPACVLVSPSSRDTRAGPSDRMVPRSPLHTHPVSRTWSLCEVLGPGSPTKEPGGAQNVCLQIMSTSCKRELLLFPVCRTCMLTALVLAAEACPPQEAFPTLGGAPWVCAQVVWLLGGLAPAPPAWRTPLIKNVVTALGSGCFCRVPRGPVPLRSTS